MYTACVLNENVFHYHLSDTVRFVFMYTACDLNENVLHYHLSDTVRLCLCIQHVILMKMFFIIT
jgi:hypothetical protein